MSLSRSWGLCLLALIGCGGGTNDGARKLALEPVEALTVFQGSERSVLFSLRWEGTPVDVTLEATSDALGLSIAPTTVSAGASETRLGLVASGQATSGELVLRARAADWALDLPLTITVATARVVSAPPAPVLRGASPSVEVEVLGGVATFDGVRSSEPAGEGRWRVSIPVPVETPLGAASLPFSTSVNGAKLSLTAAVTVTDTVVVHMRDPLGARVEDQEVFVQDQPPKLSNFQGEATFTGVVAPYRLTARRRASGTDAHTYDGVTLAAPIVSTFGYALPQRSTTLETRLEEGSSGALISGHQSAVVNAFMDGQIVGAAVHFPVGGAESSGPIAWRTSSSSIPARLRAVAYKDGKLHRYADTMRTLREGETQSLIFEMRPPPVGDIHVSLAVPSGFSLTTKELHAIFAGNPSDRLGVDSDRTSALQATLAGAFDRDDVGHSLVAKAQDLAGRTSVRSWTGLSLGATAEGALGDPPRMQGGPTPTITDATRYEWTPGEWPLYELEIQVGQDASARLEVLYTSSSGHLRPGRVVFPDGEAGYYRICGTSYFRSVDELLSVINPREDDDPLRDGASGCDASQNVTYRANP